MRALSFGHDPNDIPVVVQLALDNAEGLLQLKNVDTPRVFVVGRSDLKKLKRLGSGVCDLKTKLSAKELARYFLGVASDMTPILEAEYRSVAQLKRSVKAFLAQALRHGARNVYFLGVTGEVFEEVCADVEQRREDAEARSSSRRDAASRAAHGSYRTSELASALALFPDESIPADLPKKYVGTSPEIEIVRHLIVRASKSLEPVLIQGETGTGKEIVARSIHNLTGRFNKDRSDIFQALNCGAIPSELVGSELFGHVPGAFTDSRGERLGLFRSAGNGTVFLDEVGDLSWNHQTALLRVIEEKTVRPVGSDKDFPVEARIVAATNLDLFSMVQRKQFREDLFYRLRVLWIPTPPLRDHPGDIPILAEHMWKAIQKPETPVKLPDEILNRLKAYPWFGNARTLHAALATLHAWYGAHNLGLHHLKEVMKFFRQEPTADSAPSSADPIDLHRIECLRHLRRAEETVRTAKVALREIDTPKRTVARVRHATVSALAERIRELDALCLKPSLFYSNDAFEAVYLLKGRLMDLRVLLPERLAEARTCYANSLKGLFGQTVSAICRGIERVLADYDRNSHAAPYNWVLKEREG